MNQVAPSTVTDALPDSFYAHLDADSRLVAEMLERWARLRGLSFQNGRHAEKAQSWYVFRTQPRPIPRFIRFQPERYVVDGVIKAGIISVHMDALRGNYFDHVANRRDLLRRLHSIIPDKAYLRSEKTDTWVSVRWHELRMSGAVGKFIDLLDWTLEMLSR